MLIEEYALINAYLFGLSAIIGNIILSFIIQNSNIVLTSYKVLIHVVSVHAILYTIVNLLVNPTLDFDNEEVVLLVQGGIIENNSIANYLLVLYLLMIIVSIILPTIHFIYRYIHIIKPQWLINSHRSYVMSFLLIIPTILSISSTFLFCYECWPNDILLARYTADAYNVNVVRNSAFFIITIREIADATTSIRFFQIDYAALFATVYVILLILSSTIIILFCYYYIIHSLRSTDLSPKTLAMQRQLVFTMVAQAVLGFFLIHTPFLLACFAPMFGYFAGRISLILPFLFSLYPAISPFVVLFFVKDIRRKLVKFAQHLVSTTKKTTILPWISSST